MSKGEDEINKRNSITSVFTNNPKRLTNMTNKNKIVSMNHYGKER